MPADSVVLEIIFTNQLNILIPTRDEARSHSRNRVLAPGLWIERNPITSQCLISFDQVIGFITAFYNVGSDLHKPQAANPSGVFPLSDIFLVGFSSQIPIHGTRQECIIDLSARRSGY